MGPPGLGKYSLVRMLVEEYAAKLPAPPDWCYIHNFEVPEKPIALQLPTGKGCTFQQEMKVLISDTLSSMLTVFESDEYNSGMQKINDEFTAERSISRKHVDSNLKKDKIPNIYKERHDKEYELKNRLLNAAVDPLFSKFKKKYAKHKKISKYLHAAQLDIIEHVDDFIKLDEKSNIMTYAIDNYTLIKYKVNLLIDNSELKNAPIIYEKNPIYSNLICRVEHTTYQGSLVTNFTLIRPGSLHLANGGFLLIEARKIKNDQKAWEALKDALSTKFIKMEPTEHMPNSIKPISLQPMSIPLNVKVILLGDRNNYYSLCQNDPDFTDLFKVPIDFDEQIHRTKKNKQLYVRLLATIADREKLLPFHVSAVAEIIEHSSRLAEDNEKLSTYISDIENLMLEAAYWASLSNKQTVKAEDVKRAITAQMRRMDRAKEIYYEDIKRNFVIIHTEGKLIGHVNCLSVRKVGNYSYGHPTRVTARVRAGKGKLIDIQREIEMAGPMHTKAGLIITSFLASQFNQTELFSLTVSIAFEQVYCWTDGDSASVGELCALLSAIADVPVLQSLAITGSVDQYGEVQAIGCVNEKIEGYFDVCKLKGLTGNQGVIIPEVNKKNLMLREDIVQAAKEKQFFIYPINTVHEAISLLTGMPTGGRNINGCYPESSLYGLIEKKLQMFTTKRKSKK
jgi:lon-related putative ATP-dependent protease